MKPFVQKDAITLAANILEDSDAKTAQLLATEFKGYPILIVQGAQLLNEVKGLTFDEYKEKIQNTDDTIKLNIMLAINELKPSAKNLLQKIALINNQAFSKNLLRMISDNPDRIGNDIYYLTKFALISSANNDEKNPNFEMHDVIYDRVQSINSAADNAKILSEIIDKINTKTPRYLASQYDFFHKDLTIKGSLEVIFKNVEKYALPFNQTLKLADNLLAFYMSDLDYSNCSKMKAWLTDKEKKKLVDLTTMDDELKAAYAGLKLNIGIYEQFANSNFKESVDLFKKAEDIMQNIPGYPAIKFGILCQTAQIYAWNCDLVNAEQYLIKVEKLMHDYPHEDFDKGFWWFIKAKIFLITNQKDKALVAIDKCSEHSINANADQDSAFTAPDYTLKAEILDSLGDHVSAYGIIKRVFDEQIGDKAPNHELQARILTTLASIEANLDKLDDALKHIEQACQIFQNGNTEISTDYAASLSVKGYTLAKKNQYKAALKNYLVAEKIYRNRYLENFGTTNHIYDLLLQAAAVAGKANDKVNEDRLTAELVKYYGQPNSIAK
jgi:hypothetical protein